MTKLKKCSVVILPTKDTTRLTNFIANDGTHFDDRNKCQKYELLCNKVEIIMDTLNPAPHNTDFGSGSGYIQQDKETYSKTIKEFMKVCAEELPIYSNWFSQVGSGEKHISHIERILSDYNIKCLYSAFLDLIALLLKHIENMGSLILHHMKMNVRIFV